MDRRVFEEEDPFANLMDSLASMADHAARPEKIESQIKESAQRIKDELSSTNHAVRPTICTGLYRCGTALSIKAPLYAVLTGIVATFTQQSGGDVVAKVCELVVRDFTDSMREGRVSTARRSLRFLCCLANAGVIKLICIADYIHSLLDAALFELTTANRSEFGVHCRGEFLAEIALSSLPWVGRQLAEHCPAELEKIVQIFTDIAEVWKAGMWRCIAPSTDRRSTDSFAELMDGIYELREKKWKMEESVMPWPYDLFEEQLKDGLEIVVPNINIPGHSKKTRYSPPRARLMLVNPRVEKKEVVLIDESNNDKSGIGDTANEDSMSGVTRPDKMKEEGDESVKDADDARKADVQAGETKAALSADTMDISANSVNSKKVVADPDANGGAPGATASIPDLQSSGPEVRTEKKEPERSPDVSYVIRCYVTDIIDNFSGRHLMAAERLLNIPMLKGVNDEIVEGLFTQMCALPFPPFSPVYYGTLFADLCRVKDSRLPAKLLVAVKAMFQHADELDPEIFDRLTDWFAFHLSNFGYKWNWQEWAVYADSEMVEKFPFRALFCKDVISRCVRLSYHDRVKSILPDEMKVFLPPQTNNGNRERFDDTVNDRLMAIVTGKGRQPLEIVESNLAEWVQLKNNEEGGIEDEEAELNLARLSALIRAILQAGCRTLSHFDIVVERYMELLRMQSLKGGAPARRLITAEVSVFWRDVHIRKLYVLDKLAQYKVIDHLSILDSCLSFEKPGPGYAMEMMSDGELTVRLSQSSPWEIIRLVMSRARAREEGSRNELINASQAAANATEGGHEEAERRLERAKITIEEAKSDICSLLSEALQRLFSMVGRLLDSIDADMDADGTEKVAEEKHRLPGFNGKPIWYWRCLGMIRELARMHPQHLPQIIDELDTHTKELREKHRVLWESFDIIKETELSSMTTQVM